MSCIKSLSFVLLIANALTLTFLSDKSYLNDILIANNLLRLYYINICFLIIFTLYFLLNTTTITTVGIKFFGKIWTILFYDGIIKCFIQYLIRCSIECYLIVQESYVFLFFRDAG